MYIYLFITNIHYIYIIGRPIDAKLYLYINNVYKLIFFIYKTISKY